MPNNHSTFDTSAELDLQKCHFYVEYLRDHPKRPSATGAWPSSGPAITISSQTGAGANEIGRQLAAILQDGEPEGGAPWTVFDRHLAEHVLEEHHLPKSLTKLMPEDRRSYLDDVLDEMAGLRPPSWELIPKLAQTVMHLAGAGHVILIGRGASFITGDMPNVFHVRLIASLEKRIARVQQRENLSPKEAANFIARTDRGRERYVKAYFRARVKDDLHYHMVLNTDRVPLDERG